MKTWIYDPQSGGVKIPKSVRERTKQRILAYAKANYSGKYTRLSGSFHGTPEEAFETAAVYLQD